MFNTPILFLVFNRPDTTRQVFAKIREIQPKQLFIAADGAREGKEGEQEKVEKVRKLILEGIDWDCEVKTLFREKNLGCGKSVSQAITWFFDYVEQGIILEDDILPDLSFFHFCEQMLEKYKNQEDVGMIAGYNQASKFKSKHDYVFTKAPGPIWGWATWRRMWEKYDFELKDDYHFKWDNYPCVPKEKIERYKSIHQAHYQKNMDRLDYWAFQCGMAMLKNNFYSIRSCKNLIKNIGLLQGTHYVANWDSLVYAPKVYNLRFPLKHPEKIEHEKGFLEQVEKKIQERSQGKYSKAKMLKLRLLNFLNII